MRFNRLLILRLAFWAAAFLSLYMASLPSPPQVPGGYADKVQHFLAFAVLAALGSAAYPRLSLVILGVALAAFGAAIELFQMNPAISRDASIADWLADVAGAVVVLVCVHRMRSRKTDRLPEEG